VAITALLVLAVRSDIVPVGGVGPLPVTAAESDQLPSEPLELSDVADGPDPVTVKGDVAEVLVAMVLVPAKTAL
jgi:hypothetical protein